MSEAPGLIDRLRASLGYPARARSALPVAPGGHGPIGPTAGAIIPPYYPANWWQRALPMVGGGESATVNAAVNAYAQTLAQLPGGHFRKLAAGGAAPITTSALSRVLRWPNPYQTRSDFMLNLVTELLFTGNAYAWAERNDRQEVAALHLMASRGCQPLVDLETRAIFYALTDNPLAGRAEYAIPSRDVLHIRCRTAAGEPLRGVSPITWAAMARDANVAISATQQAFFNNASQPSGFLSTKERLTPDQMGTLREAWDNRATGVARGEVPILGGGLEFQQLGISSQDAQLVEAFRMTVADIARAFAVPLPIIGDLSNATFNNVENLIGLWLSQGLGFYLEHIETALDRFFGLPADEYVEFDSDSLMRTAFRDRIEGLTRAVTGGLYSPDEARAREGLPPAPDGFGKEPRLQAQVVPLSQVGAVPAAPAEPAAPALPGDTPGDTPDDTPTSRAIEAIAPRLEAIIRGALPAAPPALVGVEARPDLARRELVTVHRMSDGSSFETRARMMPAILPPDHAAAGWGVIKGDMIREGDFDRTALVDDPEPGKPEHWAVREVRGRRGRDGKPGAAAIAEDADDAA